MTQNNSSRAQAALAIFPVLLGVLSASQARINGSLADRVGHGLIAATISFIVGLASLVVLAVVNRSGRAGAARIWRAVRERSVPWWAFTGGLCGATYILAQSMSVPLLGVAPFISAMVLGQVIGSMCLDAFGWLDLPRHPITTNRIIGAVVMVIAVLIVAWGKPLSVVAIALLALGVVSGIALSVQMAATGRLNVVSQEGIGPSLVNFLIGTAVLLVVSSVGVATGLVPFHTPPTDPTSIWLYVGGFVGVVYIMAVALFVRRVGAFVLTLGIVAGQLLGSLLWDTLTGNFNWLMLIGLPLAFAGMVIANFRAGARRTDNRAADQDQAASDQASSGQASSGT
ncbi:DMT family transporter [Parenemella sanctibonifatiensis]|uniref:DMT family transporter n=1 Tax=Parenemella sanctibonifatiensis TaxID=2016505 RepID=A0A255EIJ7_9ACTN|nr:DMT family transporter [Parenemella sanctibonifatiensis]OYN91347.1 hypothetical protein CGZ91_07925 [Parenemella sanctibonifatiensis]